MPKLELPVSVGDPVYFVWDGIARGRVWSIRVRHTGEVVFSVDYIDTESTRNSDGGSFLISRFLSDFNKEWFASKEKIKEVYPELKYNWEVD